MDYIDPSKTEKKKEMHALQKLAIQLAGLGAETLKSIPMSSHLYDALREYQKITSNSAKRRQAQYLGKLMRSVDNLDEIKGHVAALDEKSTRETAAFHLCERWRDKLIVDDKETLTLFLQTYPGVDSQQLRHVIKKAKSEKEKGVDRGAFKALFRFIKEVI
jgi:ribosome-associated protein